MYLISACLLGINCRYDGSNNKVKPLIDFLNMKDEVLIPICPEQLGGLKTPRNPAEIIHEKVMDCEGNEVTKQFEQGRDETLKIASFYKDQIKGCILKDGSPSCGVYKIYDGTFSNKKIDGMGLTARQLKSKGYKIYSEEDLLKIKEEYKDGK